MKKYKELKEMLCDELDEIVSKGELSAGELDIVDKLTHSIKSLETIMAMDNAGSLYSSDAAPYYRTSTSYSRPRKSDNMERYSRDAGRGKGKSKAYMIEQLEEMMTDAETEKEREAIRKCILQLEG